ncbi:MAG: hypothetical protein PF961_22085 [Planctomycetota bacterium]|jgi:hypothetical protein|nr:hypothetical protein [Planctomycetota bacterium]
MIDDVNGIKMKEKPSGIDLAGRILVASYLTLLTVAQVMMLMTEYRPRPVWPNRLDMSGDVPELTALLWAGSIMGILSIGYMLAISNKRGWIMASLVVLNTLLPISMIRVS